MKFGFDRPSSFGEEDVSALWIRDDRRTTTTDARPWVYYKLAFGSGELKILEKM